jgi:hypothetical protein
VRQTTDLPGNAQHDSLSSIFTFPQLPIPCVRQTKAAKSLIDSISRSIAYPAAEFFLHFIYSRNTLHPFQEPSDIAMVLDPMSALAVAGAVVQFVDFGTKFVGKVASKSYEIYSAFDENEDYSRHPDWLEEKFKTVDRLLETDSRRILMLTEKLRVPLQSVQLSPEDQALQDLCDGCNSLANEIGQHLHGLKLEGRKRKIDIFRKAVKATWTEGHLNSLVKRFSMLKEMLELHVLVDIRFVIFDDTMDLILTRYLI